MWNLVNSLETKSEEDSSVFYKVEPIKQVKAVLCVLPNALLVTLQKMPKIQGLGLRDLPVCTYQQRYHRPNPWIFE